MGDILFQNIHAFGKQICGFTTPGFWSVRSQVPGWIAYGHHSHLTSLDYYTAKLIYRCLGILLTGLQFNARDVDELGESDLSEVLAI